TIEYIKDPSFDILSTLKAPDFPTGGEIVFEKDQIDQIYETGKGSVRIRCKWSYNKKENIIEITQIPYTTTIEAIIDKVAELIKDGKLKDISDIRDETGLNGLKIAIDLKRGADPDKLMKKLMKTTPLMDTFSCNFNILISGVPKVMGVREILDEWTAWRCECIKRKLFYDLNKKKNRLHLLKGLSKILLDIDKAIAIIRNTEEEEEVIPNLMIGFGIDEEQAEFVAEIKLRNINKAYILKRISETDELEKAIDEIEKILASRQKVLDIIISELEGIIKRFPTKRKSEIVYDVDDYSPEEDEPVSDHQVTIFLTKEGYFKKITPLSLRMGKEEHKLKDGDEIVTVIETTNNRELIVFTNKAQAYKCRLSDFEDGKASALGEYLPQKLSMDEGEAPIGIVLPEKADENLIFVFENGKVAKVPLSAYETKSNRRRLTNAYSDKSPVCRMFAAKPDVEIAMYSGSRLLVINTAVLQLKTTRTTQGVSVMSVKKGRKVDDARLLSESGITNPSAYRKRSLPAAGTTIKPEDMPEKQLTLD
ncbi:MAG: topoisomerase IV, partial [Clostridia bacterium]|nr:topoisomerase IV [Clostridia bacterium]